MKKTILFFVSFFMLQNMCFAEKFPVDTLINNGSPDKFINLVVMGDGFTEIEQNFFIEKANLLFEYIFTQEPLKSYRKYFNAYAVKVVSNESGVTHPGTGDDCPSHMPVTIADTYFGCTFDMYGIHRLLVVGDHAKLNETLADNLPQYDLAFVLSNTEEYGGSGGQIAVSSINGYATEIVVHEMAHSFADIGDEYWAGDFYARERTNLTQESDPSKVKWKNWCGNNGVGVYQHTDTELAKLWYRPHNECRMRILGRPFCNVCRQTLVKEIINKMNPIIEYSPVELTVSDEILSKHKMKFELNKLVLPEPNTVKIKWELDGENLISFENQSECQLTEDLLNGNTHTLKAQVTDMTGMLRLDNGEERVSYSVTWAINRTLSGIEMSSSEQKLSYSLYPTVTKDELNIYIELDNNDDRLSVKIIDINGKIVKTVVENHEFRIKYEGKINVEDLPSGIYFVIYETGGSKYSLKFIKS